MKKIATVNMEQYNEDEVGVSMWACPIYGGGRIVWCGPCRHLRVGVSSYAGGGGGWLCRGEGKRWSLISSEHRQHMCTQQVMRVYVCVCTCASTNVTNECRFEGGAHG